jgi:signal transduction histidine kinase
VAKSLFKLSDYRFWLLLVWLAFTVSLSIWWIIFGERQLGLISASGLSSSEEIIRGQRMLFWEGLTLVLSLVSGAVAFFFLAKKERKESQAAQNFLLTFTHELKTPIASLRLQAEELSSRLSDSSEKELLKRLVSDTSRLTLQLDNCLFLASLDSEKVFLENIPLSLIQEQIAYDWPELKIVANKQAQILGDRRVLLSIFRNLVHNAVCHAKATSLSVDIQQQANAGFINLSISDDGKGFSGDARNLGKLFQRQGASSGSGIGLYLVRKLAKVIGGNCSFEIANSRLLIKLKLPGAIEE